MTTVHELKKEGGARKSMRCMSKMVSLPQQTCMYLEAKEQKAHMSELLLKERIHTDTKSRVGVGMKDVCVYVI